MNQNLVALWSYYPHPFKEGHIIPYRFLLDFLLTSYDNNSRDYTIVLILYFF